MRISTWISDVCSSDLTDDEGLRHAVDAPVDGNAAIPVGAGPGVGIAQGIEPACGILGPVPVDEAMDRHDAFGAEPHEERMLVAAGGAPGGKDIDQRDFALEVSARQSPCPRSEEHTSEL